MSEYKPEDIEKKWQESWEKDGLHKVEDKVEGKENYYTLVEFSYPSGNLHVGHWYAFAVPDIFARFKKMNGFNVLYPMGFDAFGLPAENAAIKEGANPRNWTYKQMDTMRAQLRTMGAIFPWDREVVSCSPEYYKWTQWMFNQFLKNDLVYRDTTNVNWCPKDKTVLANEQVNDGCCDRCGTEVVQKTQEQWMIRITKYADRLIDDLENLDWPNAIKASQKSWIGRSEGSELTFKLNTGDEMKVFTTRADTLFGCTYVVFAPEHETVQKMKDSIENWDEVEVYIKDSQKKSELDRQQSKEKTGVELKGIKATNPVNGEEVPVWVADYVLAGYGTGAVMAVPAHDERDFEFANKFNLEIKEVISGKTDEEIFVGYGTLINSGEFDGMSSEDARVKITEKVGGEMKKTYRLRDWGVSRQRYWGTPIPVVYDPRGKAHAVPDEHLPWALPEDVDHTPDGTAPLARSEELKKRTEEIFGEGWTPEVETMDTFVDSTWYFYRYLDSLNDKEFASKERMDSFMPIDLYMGGAEHTTMHVLYSRFWTKALYDLGLVKDEEAFKVRLNRGLILGPDGDKMSKSKGNVINPDELVEKLGADTVRLYLCFMGPYGVTVNYPWDPNGVVGVRRFLERVWRVKDILGDGNPEDETLLHQTIEGVTRDIEKFKFNTAISKMMVLVNAWEKSKTVSKEDYKELMKLLAPFAPHMTEELWREVLGETESVHTSAWPEFDPEKIKTDSVEMVVQVNGKVRSKIQAQAGLSKDEALELANSDENVKKWITGEPKKVIYVQDKLLNIVV